MQQYWDFLFGILMQNVEYAKANMWMLYWVVPGLLYLCYMALQFFALLLPVIIPIGVAKVFVIEIIKSFKSKS